MEFILTNFLAIICLCLGVWMGYKKGVEDGKALAKLEEKCEHGDDWDDCPICRH